MYAITLRPDNTAAEVELPDDTGSGHQTLDSLYREIGCRYVEFVQLAPDLYAWFDHDAEALPLNRPACAINSTYGHGSAIVGTVVYTGGADTNGNTQALSKTRARELRTHLENHGRGPVSAHLVPTGTQDPAGRDHTAAALRETPTP